MVLLIKWGKTMKRGRKPLNIKNITFTMSITQAEAETLSKHGSTYQKAIRNLINEERQKDLNEAIGGTAKTAQSSDDGSQNENEAKASAAVCPHCGKSHYVVDNITTTVLATPTIVRDGMIVPQPGADKAVAHCTCLECGKSFETGQIPLGKMLKVDPIPTTAVADASDKGAE